MNKAQLIDAVADRLGGSRRDANEAVEAVIDTITRTVAGGDRVAITGFGVFEKIDRPARTARNPRTGERVKVKKTAVPRFRAGQGLKDVVSGSRKLPRLTATRPAASAARAVATKTATTTASKSASAKPASSKVGASAAKASTAGARSAAKSSSARAGASRAGMAKASTAAAAAKKATASSGGKKASAKRTAKK